MMNEENRKGPGIFYAVVGVATLVVAIIGATFAFFSATATNNDVIQGNTASAGGIYLTVRPITGDGKDLIPLNVNVGDTEGVDTTDQFDPAMAGKCVDKNGNRVCQVYAISVANKSTTSKVQIQGSLTLTSQAKNMHWKLIEVTPDGTFTFDPATATPTDTITTLTTATKATAFETDYVTTTGTATGNVTVGGNTGGDGAAVASQNLGFTTADNAATYYILVWLEETGAAQEDLDAAKTFTGSVTFNAVDAAGNTSGLTASF